MDSVFYEKGQDSHYRTRASVRFQGGLCPWISGPSTKMEPKYPDRTNPCYENGVLPETQVNVVRNRRHDGNQGFK